MADVKCARSSTDRHVDGRRPGIAEIVQLKSAAALRWAADCVGHLAERVGDTPDQDVASCVRLARRYAQDRVFDSAAAHEQRRAVRRVHRATRLRPGGAAGQAIGMLMSLAVPEATPALEMFEPRENGGSGSEYARRKRELRTQMAHLLDAAEALCGADPLVVARDASRFCRKAEASERRWQFERPLLYLEDTGAEPGSMT